MRTSKAASSAHVPWRTYSNSKRPACRMRAMASASETISRTRMRPPHVRQRVMSSAKTRARSFAQPMRRGLGEDVGEDLAGSLERAKSSGSCGDGGGAAGLGMTCSQAMVAGEHAVVASHVEARRRDQGAEAGEELVGVHVGVGGGAAPGRLEGDADAAAGERRDGARGRRAGAADSGRFARAACGRGRRRWSRRGDSCRRRRGSSAAARTVSRARGAGRRASAARRRPARGRGRDRRRRRGPPRGPARARRSCAPAAAAARPESAARRRAAPRTRRR